MGEFTGAQLPPFGQPATHEDYEDYAVALHGILTRIAERRRCVWCGGVCGHDEECELAAALKILHALRATHTCMHCGAEMVRRRGKRYCKQAENPVCFRERDNLKSRKYHAYMSDEKRAELNERRRVRKVVK